MQSDLQLTVKGTVPNGAQGILLGTLVIITAGGLPRTGRKENHQIS